MVVKSGKLEGVGGYDVDERVFDVLGGGGKDAGGFCGGDGLEDGECGGAAEGEPLLEGGGGPVCVGDEDGRRRGDSEHRGEGGRGDGFQDGHVSHGEGEVLVCVVDGDVLRCAGRGG